MITVEQIAEVCHEANRAYCATLGDKSQGPWVSTPELMQDSVVDGVWFHLANPTAKPKDSHERWLAEKRTAGWKYGPAKDESKKEHPCMVPYKDLPPTQQAKDVLFIGIVHALRGLLA
jgi:hypothetical protein